MANNLNFTEFVNINVKILGRRFAFTKFEAWLEDAQLIFPYICL